MTNREFYKAVIKGEITDEVVAMAQSLIEALDRKNEGRKTKTAEKHNSEYAPLIEACIEFLSEQEAPVKASEIATAIGVTTSKATCVAKAVPNIEVIDIKVKGGRAVKGYFLAK